MTDQDKPKPGGVDRRKFLSTVGAGVTVGVAGCTGGGNDSEAQETTTTESGGGTDTETATTTSDGEPRDFGGQEINVMLNGGPIQRGFREIVIPRVEEKYNLNINSSVGFTTEQMTKVRSNPNNPPDAFNMDVIGVAAGHREDWLEPLDQHKDILTNWDRIYPKLRHESRGYKGLSWSIGEVGPVLNTSTGVWDADNLPTTQDEVFKGCQNAAITPFSWSNGPYMLLLASSIVSGADFSGTDHDIDGAFDYLEENLASKNPTTITGESQLRNMIGSGQADTIPSIYMFGMFDVYENVDAVAFARNLEPTSVAIAETLAVAKNSDNKEAALAYVNEAFHPEVQKELSQFMGTGTAVNDVPNQPAAEKFGAPTPEQFGNLKWPDFDYVAENRSDWANRWNSLFGQG